MRMQMRISRIAVIILLAGLVAATACSHHVKPPTGRWVGNYDTPDIMVDARLEILPDGKVRVSALDITNVGDVSDQERAALHTRLASELEVAWHKVETRQMDFDGKVFRKPGGFAPQMEWNPLTHEMKVVFYFGMQHSIRIVMQQTDDFANDTWRQPQQ
jgi:hypothetical protein